jgi:pyruvate/2-oxoglutarate dehydrogenase complex dihydrolipoamide acyltransferase (E2) component
MPLFRRSDGELVTDLSPLRRIMPYLMKTRNESAVYFDQVIDVTPTLEYLHRVNGEGERRLSFFQIVLCAAVRTLAMRPVLNRFVVGKRVYRRNTIDISFVVKKAFTDEASMTMVKVTFDPADTLETVAQRVKQAVEIGRGEKLTASEQEMNAVRRLPRFLIGLLVRLQRLLDHFNLLPARLIRSDPLYTSLALANVGSVGLDAAYHHLYEYGTASMFATLGRIHKGLIVTESGEQLVRDVVTIRYSLDERITDALYGARSMELFRSFIEQPELLERPPEG